jgi:hypothetical protein
VDRPRSGFLTLDDINAGFDRLADGSVVRQILRFSEQIAEQNCATLRAPTKWPTK